MTLHAADSLPAAPVSRPDFTILLPIIRPPTTLDHALGTVLAQTVDSFEVVILCDGAPPETVIEAERLATTDRRVRVAAFSKGARNGEAHRAVVVANATGRNLAQIADDDLWFPDHLSVLRAALGRVDFANTPQMNVLPDGTMRSAAWGHLRALSTRERMLREKFNFFGPTQCAYRRSAYDALPDGWTPAPEGSHSDLFMWRKFIARGDLCFDSVMRPTSLKFPARHWQNESPEAADKALRYYAEILRRPEESEALRRRAFARIAAERTWREYLQLLRLDPASFVALAPKKLANAIGRRLPKDGLMRS